MHQNARSVVELLSRELHPAGYGMATMPARIAAVIANEPSLAATFSASALTVRWNALDATSLLGDDMPQPSAELKVTSVAGFAVGSRIMIWDATGSYDFLIVTQVQDSSHLQHNTVAASKAYKVADGTTVEAMTEVTYRWVSSTRQVQRMENAGPWLVVAENVESFRLRYWGPDGDEIFPATDAQRRAIRRVGVSLGTRTADRDRLTGKFRTYAMETEVVPRNLATLPQG
jgi:hypothetical protein